MRARIRIVPVILTVAISATLLFGGLALYNKLAVAAPFEQALYNIPGIDQAKKPVIADDEVNIQLRLAEDASLKDVYERIAAEGKSIIGGKTIHIETDSAPNEQLQALWNSVLFEIAEAMETRTYSNIPAALDAAAQNYEGVSVTTEMNDSYVFVTMRNGDAVQYEMLPRVPGKMGAWSNE